MKIFNLENTDRKTPANKTECLVIGTWEEWQEVIKAIDDRAKANPRSKKIRKIQEDLCENLSVW